MGLQTTTTIKIGETIITNFSHLKINQKIHDHHTFSVEIRQDILSDEYNKSVIPVSQQMFGKEISIEIKAIDGLENFIDITDPRDHVMQFYGIVTKVTLLKSRIKNTEETILIEGHSTSIILEDGPDSNSFIKMPLTDIVNKVKSGYNIDLEVNPFYKDNLAYTVQYNESTFAFLNRLAKRHAQWFYNNGRTTIFGVPGSHGGNPNLYYGVNLHDFSYKMKLMPAQFKVIENDHRQGSINKDSTLKYRKEADGFHQNFVDNANSVFNRETVIQLNQNAVGGYGSRTIEEYTKNKMRSIMCSMIQIKAASDVPGITIGNTVRITGVDRQLEGIYTVTQILHTCNDGGDYENHFTAVNTNGSVFSPKTNPDLIPACKSQTAVVTANADPDGLSGIQVQMPWQEAKGETTPYIPLLQKYGGDARGSHIIPEVGDTVFVDFQGGNAELPIVTGTMTSNKEKSGYSTPNNDLKVLETRSGNRIISDDEKGDITIESKKGETIAVVHGDGNIRFKAPKNIEFEAGEDFVVNAGRDVKTNAGQNIEETAGGYKQTTTKLFYNISVGANYFINVIGDMFEYVKGKKEIESKDIKEMAQEVMLHSTEESISLRGSKNVNSHSGESSRNS